MSATGLLPKSQIMDPLGAGISTGTNTILDAYLGQPRGGTINPMEKRNVTTWDMPEAFEGRSLFLGNTLMDWMWTANQTFYTEVVMPYKVVEDIFVEWTAWEANAHILGLTPEEATSRLISQRRTVRRAALVRRGISMQFEHGWIKTLIGRQSFWIGLGQITRSFQETANAEVIRAILHAHHYQQQYVRENGQVRRLDFLDFLREQRDYFAYFQKTANGAALWDQQTDTDMYTYHGMANTILVPEKMLTYVTFRPENTQYLLAGPRGPDRVDDIPGKNSEITPVHLADRLEPQRWMNKKSVYQVRAFHVDGVQPVDLLSKPIQIGEYYTMTDEHCVYDEKYTSTERAIMIFDEDRDKFAKVDLNMALEASQLFDSNGRIILPTPPDTGSDQMAQRDRLLDPFIIKYGQSAGKASTEYFGQIDPAYQPLELLEHVGRVASAKSRVRTTGALNEQQLVNMFGGPKNKLSNVTVKDVLVAGTKAAVPQAGGSGPRGESGSAENNNNTQAELKATISGFKDMIAATVRTDRDVQQQVRRFFPDTRAPTSTELNALKDFAARNAVIEGDYSNFFNPRRGQLEIVLKNIGAVKSSPSSERTSEIQWVPVGDSLPEGYQWLQDEQGQEIFSGLIGVSTFDNLPFVRAQRALQALNAASEAAPIQSSSTSSQSARYGRQGFHTEPIGLMQEFDEDGVTEKTMQGRELVQDIIDEYVNMLATSPLDDEEKLAVLYYLCAPVIKQQFRAFITYNLPFPGNFLLARAHACYRGRQAIKLLAGQIGNTYFAHMNAELGQDASRMIGLLHVVAYMSAIVEAPQHVYVEQAPYVDEYYGGMGMQFWDPDSYQRRVQRGNQQSILCFFVPYAEKSFPNPMDIAGRFYVEYDYGLFNLHNRYENLHFSTAYRYNYLYQIYTRATAHDDMSVPTVIPDDVHVNRVCWEGEKRSWNRSTTSFDHVTKNTGHWGPTYAGCGKVRKGLVEYLEGTAAIDIRATH